MDNANRNAPQLSPAQVDSLLAQTGELALSPSQYESLRAEITETGKLSPSSNRRHPWLLEALRQLRELQGEQLQLDQMGLSDRQPGRTNRS